MTGTEAYIILSKLHPLSRVRGCLDFGSFYVFSIVPIHVEDNVKYFSGTIMPAVDKKTGRVFEYDLTSDINAYHRAKNVKVETIFDKKIN